MILVRTSRQVSAALPAPSNDSAIRIVTVGASRTMTEIEKQTIERACEQLQYAYARFIDFRDYEGFTELFTVDGVLDAGLELKGRDAIFSSCQKRSAGLRSRHVITNSFIDVLSHDQARGICYLSLYRLDQKESAKPGPLPIPGPAAVGHYQDSFQLVGTVWKLAHRKLHLAFRDDSQF